TSAGPTVALDPSDTSPPSPRSADPITYRTLPDKALAAPRGRRRPPPRRGPRPLGVGLLAVVRGLLAAVAALACTLRHALLLPSGICTDPPTWFHGTEYGPGGGVGCRPFLSCSPSTR